MNLQNAAINDAKKELSIRAGPRHIRRVRRPMTHDRRGPNYFFYGGGVHSKFGLKGYIWQ